MYQTLGNNKHVINSVSAALALLVSPSLAKGEQYQSGDAGNLGDKDPSAHHLPIPNHAKSWSQFRGPNGQGVVTIDSIPIELDLKKQLLWRVDVPAGNSSPIILDDGSIVYTAVSSNRLATVSHSPVDGSVKWMQSVPVVQIRTGHPFNSPASSTPVSDGTRTFAYFGSFGLVAYGPEGEELWQRPLSTSNNRWGSASSPILCKHGLLLVVDSEEGKSFMVLVNPQNGEILWKKDRHHFGSSWSTPIVWETSRGDELIVHGQKRLDAYNPKTGELIWWLGGLPNDAVTVPVVHGKSLIINNLGLGSIDTYGSYPTWTEAMQFDSNQDGKLESKEFPSSFGSRSRNEVTANVPGVFYPITEDLGDMDTNHDGFVTQDEWNGYVRSLVNDNPKNRIVAINEGAIGDAKSNVAWESGKGISEVPSPVVYKERLYTIRDGGVLTCMDASSGKIIYQERVGAAGEYLASPIVVEANNQGCIIVVSTKGVVTVALTGDNFHVAQQVDIGESVGATPAVSDGRIYIRTDRSLFALGLSTRKAFVESASSDSINH